MHYLFVQLAEPPLKHLAGRQYLKRTAHWANTAAGAAHSVYTTFQQPGGLSTHLCGMGFGSALTCAAHWAAATNPKRDPMSVSRESGHELCDGRQRLGQSSEQCWAAALFSSNIGMFDLGEPSFGCTQILKIATSKKNTQVLGGKKPSAVKIDAPKWVSVSAQRCSLTCLLLALRCEKPMGNTDLNFKLTKRTKIWSVSAVSTSTALWEKWMCHCKVTAWVNEGTGRVWQRQAAQTQLVLQPKGGSAASRHPFWGIPLLI